MAVPYGLGVRDQVGRSAHDGAAYRSAVCLAGWFSSAVFAGQITGLQISPGDLDEGVQFLLQYGQDPKVLPGVDRTGFQLVDLFRQGFLHGGQPCDVGMTPDERPPAGPAPSVRGVGAEGPSSEERDGVPGGPR